jgi:hypothetical protein
VLERVLELELERSLVLNRPLVYLVFSKAFLKTGSLKREV